MPTDEENVQYLYLVLTAGGPPTIDFGEVGKALELKNGAVTKRWSRLKQAMNEGKTPGPSAYEFLWLLVKHSTRDKAPDWADIAAKCNTTSGAASKRYSRMKQAFERGDAAPTSAKATGEDAATPGSPAKSTPKRKRAPPKKKHPAQENTNEENLDDGDEEEKPTPKKRRTPAKPRAKKGAKKDEIAPQAMAASVPPTEATTLIKTEGAGEGEGGEYYDQGEYAAGGEVANAEGEIAQEHVSSWLEETEV